MRKISFAFMLEGLLLPLWLYAVVTKESAGQYYSVNLGDTLRSDAKELLTIFIGNSARNLF